MPLDGAVHEELQGIYNDFSDLERLWEAMEKHVPDLHAAEIEAIRRPRTERVIPRPLQDVYQWEARRWGLISAPTLLRYSIWLQTMGQLEAQLHDLAQLLRRERGVQVDVSDLRGFGLRPVLTFLTKVVGLPALPTELERPVLAAVAVRNAIAHRNGAVFRKGKIDGDVRHAVTLLHGIDASPAWDTPDAVLWLEQTAITPFLLIARGVALEFIGQATRLLARSPTMRPIDSTAPAPELEQTRPPDPETGPGAP